MTPLSVGSQTGGSVIRPASFNGTYGLKPTVGKISRKGMLLQSHTLDTIGFYGRKLWDLALIATCLAGETSAQLSEDLSTQGFEAFENWAGDLKQPNFAFLET